MTGGGEEVQRRRQWWQWRWRGGGGAAGGSGRQTSVIGCATLEMAYTSSPAAPRRSSSVSGMPPRCDPATRSSLARSVRTVPYRLTSVSRSHSRAAGMSAAAPRRSSGRHASTSTVQNSRAVGVCSIVAIDPTTPHEPSASREGAGRRRRSALYAAAITTAAAAMLAAGPLIYIISYLVRQAPPVGSPRKGGRATRRR